MYNSQQIARQIKSIAKQKKLPVGKLLDDCGLSKNALSTMQARGSLPRVENLVKIADELNCSLDFLLGRNLPSVSTNTGNVNDNGVVIGQLNGTATIRNGMERALTAQEKDLLNIYNSVNGKKQMKLMSFAYELEEDI